MAHPEAIKVLSSGSAREPMVPRFADPAHEAAFKQRYAEQRRSQDYFLLTPAAPLVLFAAMRSLRDGEWKAVALSCFEAALFVALQLAMRHAPAAYLRWRSMLLTAVYLGHFSMSRLLGYTVVSPGCPAWLVSWAWREINLSQLPWSALISLCLPLPVSHAAVAQAALVVLATAWLPSLRRDSFQLCAATQGLYQSAASGLAVAAACVLPPPLGQALLRHTRQLGPSAFYAVHVAGHVAVNYVLVLAVVFRWELQQRRTFARQRRLAADAAALVRAQRSCGLSLPLMVLAFALLWAALTLALAKPAG